jgi:acyl carrier protein
MRAITEDNRRLELIVVGVVAAFALSRLSAHSGDLTGMGDVIATDRFETLALRDLGIDSIASMDLLTSLEAEFGISLGGELMGEDDLSLMSLSRAVLKCHQPKVGAEK